MNFWSAAVIRAAKKFSIKSFYNNDSGNLALMFGLSVTVVAGISGFAVDYGRALMLRSNLQSGMDAAVLAAVTTGDQAKAQNIINEYFQANSASSGTLQVNNVQWTTNATDFVVSADGKISMPTTLMRAIGWQSFDVSVTSAAAAKRIPDAIRIHPNNATGYWPKDIRFRVRRDNLPPETVLNVDYRPTSLVHPGTGPMFISSTGWIDISDVEDFWLEMHVKQTSTTDPQVIANAPVDQVIFSNDPNTAHHLFVNGQQQPHGVLPPIYSSLPCGTATHDWEDGGGFNEQDFRYTIDVSCFGVDASTVRLVE